MSIDIAVNILWTMFKDKTTSHRAKETFGNFVAKIVEFPLPSVEKNDRVAQG